MNIEDLEVYKNSYVEWIGENIGGTPEQERRCQLVWETVVMA